MSQSEGHSSPGHNESKADQAMKALIRYYATEATPMPEHPPHLLLFLSFAQADTRATAVLINEFNTGAF